jgi:hypothetical protein
LEFGGLAKSHTCFGDLAKSLTVLQVLQLQSKQTRHGSISQLDVSIRLGLGSVKPVIAKAQVELISLEVDQGADVRTSSPYTYTKSLRIPSSMM